MGIANLHKRDPSATIGGTIQGELNDCKQFDANDGKRNAGGVAHFYASINLQDKCPNVESATETFYEANSNHSRNEPCSRKKGFSHIMVYRMRRVVSPSILK